MFSDNCRAIGVKKKHQPSLRFRSTMKTVTCVLETNERKATEIRSTIRSLSLLTTIALLRRARQTMGRTIKVSLKAVFIPLIPVMAI